MPPRDRIRAISFDADGTLWDFRAVMRRSLALVLAEAGCAPEEMLHVGDSWEDDVLGARAAGLPAVWLNREGAPRPETLAGVREVRSLAELPAALASFPLPDVEEDA